MHWNVDVDLVGMVVDLVDLEDVDLADMDVDLADMDVDLAEVDLAFADFWFNRFYGKVVAYRLSVNVV